jgi:hypothetical protein
MDQRKCRDLLCLILFTAFWGGCFFCIYYYNLINYYGNYLVLVQPFDKFRRRCGYAANVNESVGVNQPDLLAMDYSQIVLNPLQMSTFCSLANKVYPALAYPTCSHIGAAGNVTETRAFFSKMTKYGAD